MSRFRIDHPHDPELHAYAGHDHMLGLFVEIFRGDRSPPMKELAVLANNNNAVSIMDCLDFLASNGFFDHADLEDAIQYVKWDEERFATEAALRIVSIIEQFGQDDALSD